MTTTIRKPARKRATPTKAKMAAETNQNIKSFRVAREMKSKNAANNPNGEAKPSIKPGTKTDMMITLLKRNNGATAEELMTAVGWQKPGARAGIGSTNTDRSALTANAHYKGDTKQKSVHGFLAGTVKKKLGLTLISEKKTSDEPRRYRIVNAGE